MLCVPRFPDFSGRIGEACIELDSGMVRDVFPGIASRHRFLIILTVLLERIRSGLDRKYSSAESRVTYLLSFCDAEICASNSSSAARGGIYVVFLHWQVL